MECAYSFYFILNGIMAITYICGWLAGLNCLVGAIINYPIWSPYNKIKIHFIFHIFSILRWRICKSFKLWWWEGERWQAENVIKNFPTSFSILLLYLMFLLYLQFNFITRIYCRILWAMKCLSRLFISTRKRNSRISANRHFAKYNKTEVFRGFSE